MNAERQQISLALALSAGVNLLLAFIIVWAMAVSQGLGRSPSLIFPAAAVQPDEITILMSAEPAPEEKTTRSFINSPDAAPDLAPADAATRFISSQNLRAASEAEAQPDGVKGLMTQEGVDKPFLDLANTEFREGSAEAQRPPETAPPSPASEEPPRPPENATSTDTPPEAPAPARKQPDPAVAPKNPLPDNDSATVPPETIAFRDQNSANLLPIPSLPARTPPLKRIPDRVAQPAAQAGLRKARTLGSISNKGRSAVDAIATAEGRFGKTLRTAVEKTWRRRLLTLSGMTNPGLVEVEFEVDAKGRISNVKLANPGEANPVMQDCALSSIIEAKLPPPPPELFEELRENITGTRMRLSFSFLIY